MIRGEHDASNLVGPVRGRKNRAPRAAQAVPGGEALSTKMGDVHAERAPEGLVNPAVAWGTLGAHVVNAKGAHRRTARSNQARMGGSKWT